MDRTQRTRTGGLSGPVAVLAAVLSGLLAGGMVVIQLVLLPFWRGIPPAEFRRWFSAHVDRIRMLMVPLGMATGVITVASAVLDMAGPRRNTAASVASAVATAGVIAITVGVNEPANHRFAGTTLSDPETVDLLQKWARWHHVRVLLGVAATVAAAAGLVPRSSSSSRRASVLR